MAKKPQLIAPPIFGAGAKRRSVTIEFDLSTDGGFVGNVDLKFSEPLPAFQWQALILSLAAQNNVNMQQAYGGGPQPMFSSEGKPKKSGG